MEKEYVTTSELAEILGYSSSTIRRWAKEGVFKNSRIKKPGADQNHIRYHKTTALREFHEFQFGSWNCT